MLTPSRQIAQIPLCISCARMQKNLSLNGKDHHKLYADNMLILQGLSRNISRREKLENTLATEWHSRGQGFNSPQLHQRISGVSVESLTPFLMPLPILDPDSNEVFHN